MLYFSDFLDPVKTSEIKTSKTSFQGMTIYEISSSNHFIEAAQLTYILRSLWLYISAQYASSKPTTFKVPFIIMTVLVCILIAIIVSFLLVKWRGRHARRKPTKDKPLQKCSTAEEQIPMNDTNETNHELNTEAA